MREWVWKFLLWAWITFLFLWAMGTWYTLTCPAAHAISTATSGETASDVVDDVRSAINEESAGFLSDSEIIAFIDDGVNEIVLQTQCLQTEEDLVLSTDTVSYSISTSFFRVANVALYDSGVGGSPARFSWITRTSPSALPAAPPEGSDSRPKYFFVFDDSAYFIPAPSDMISGTTVTLFLTQAPSGVTASTSAIETPAIFDGALRTYVRARCYGKEGSGMEEREATLLGLFYRQVFDAVEDLQPGNLVGVRREESPQ